LINGPTASPAKLYNNDSGLNIKPGLNAVKPVPAVVIVKLYIGVAGIVVDNVVVIAGKIIFVAFEIYWVLK
jgi:hypothetical protein